MKISVAVPLATLALLAGAARADEPLPPPEKAAHYSANGSFCAIADPGKNEIAVYDVDASRNPAKRQWSIKGWERAVYLADDGEHMVIGYSGLNLLPQDYDPETVALRFYEREKMIKSWKIGELARKSKLQKTVSHYLWRQFEGFDSNGRFEVETLDGKKFFDVKTGALLPATK